MTFGRGSLRLLGPRPLPTTLQLAQQAIGDADKWWTSLGSAPPALDLHIGPTYDSTRMGDGYLHSGRVDVAPQYLSNLQNTLSKATTWHGKQQALVGLWRLMAHERGHNIGYGHIPGGIMDETWASPPGESYVWANAILRAARRPPSR